MQAPPHNRNIFSVRAILLLLTAVWLLLWSPDASATSRGIKLYQNHEFFGANQLTVSPDGFRMENTGRLKFVVVAKPPSWQVSIFRDDDKVFVTETLAKFEEAGLVSGFVLVAKERFIRDKSRISTFNFSGKTLVRITAKDQTLKYLPLNGLPPQIERLFYSAYKCPTQGGIPTGFIRTLLQRDYVTGMRNQGRIEITLDTTKIEDVATNEKMFSVPPGYKKGKSVREVVAGSSTRAKSLDFEALFHPIK